MKQKNSPSLTRYILTGAALGVYFGWFFRPLAENPSWTTVVYLSVVIAVVMTGLRWGRGQREQLLRRLLITFLQALVVVGVLQARHLAFDMGGQMAVIALTTITGALSGAYFATRDDFDLMS